jgi:Fe-S cluster assembly protein SufD
VDGLQMGSLATALTTHSAVLEQHLARYARCDSNPFTALNTAFFLDGGLILIPKGQIVQDPIHLLFICTSREAGATAHPRNLIIAQENSQVTVLESYASTVDAPHFTNAVTEIVAGENTVVEHCKIQTESRQAFHVATVEAQVNRSAHYTSHSISTGAKLARNDIHAVLDGEGIECILNGIFVVNGDQHVDHHTIIDHAKPHCTSHEFYNGVLDGRSKGVFNGKIYVRPNAQKTDAKQTSRNLLLSNEAIVNSQPQLEIFADDVKCTHGSTVGQLNEEAIFYLRSRAIGLEKARQMLIVAFAAEIINRIKVEPVRAQLSKLLLGRLAEEDSSHV